MTDAIVIPDLVAAATPVDAGSYIYSGGPGAAGISESWARFQLPDGEALTISTRRVAEPEITVNVQTRHDNELIAEAWLECVGEVTVRAHYIIGGGGHVLLRHQVNNEAVTEHKIDAHEVDLLFPLLRVYTGPMLRGLLDSGGSALVLVPRLDCFDTPELLLTAAVSERRVESLGRDDFEIGSESVACDKLRYHGGPYIDGATCWLDGERLLGYQWQQSADVTWSVTLKLAS